MGLKPEDYDELRKAYPRMSIKEVGAFYDRIHEEFPDQNYFSPSASREFFEFVGAVSVDEIGGYDGSAAKAMLALFQEIISWHNFEISSIKPLEDMDPRYRHSKSPCWDCDAIYASHIFEHLLLGEISDALYVFRGKWLYVEAPLEKDRMDWTGQTCGHVLDGGWDDLDRVIQRARFTEFMRLPGERTGMADTVRGYRR